MRAHPETGAPTTFTTPGSKALPPSYIAVHACLACLTLHRTHAMLPLPSDDMSSSLVEPPVQQSPADDPLHVARAPFDVAGQLERIAALYEKGALNADEFSAAKAAALAASKPAQSRSSSSSRSPSWSSSFVSFVLRNIYSLLLSSGGVARPAHSSSGGVLGFPGGGLGVGTGGGPRPH